MSRNVESKRKVTEGVTFRVPKSVLDELHAEAESKQVSLNTLVNQIFTSFIRWDVNAVKAGWVPTQRNVLMKMIESLDEKTVSTIAEKSAEAVGKDVIMYMHGKYNVDEFLSNIKLGAQKSGFNIKEYADGRNLQIVMQHDLGWKWSIFFKFYYTSILHSMKQRVIFDYTENTLVINLEKD